MQIKQKKLMLAPNTAVTPSELCNVEYPMLASYKLDGFRAICAGGDLSSRRWRDYGLHVKKHFYDAITACRTGNFVLDGELYSTEHGFNELQSMLSKTVTGEKLPPSVKFFVFDGMTVPEWNDGCLRTFDERLNFITHKVHTLGLTDKVQVLDQVLLNDHSEAEKLFSKAIELGYEGLILKNPDGLYKHNRATANENSMFKMKAENTVDGVLIGYTTMKRMNEEFAADENREREATGELKRTYKQEHLQETDEIGSFEVRLADGTTFRAMVEKGVDLGLTKHNVESKLGRHVEVVYMDHGVKDKPRFPRIRRWREDLDG